MNIKRGFKVLAGLLFYVAYQELTIGYAPGPPLPPPPTPLENQILHLATVGAVIGYGAWRVWKK